MPENSCEQTTFGYLSALEWDTSGVFGGYLLISPLGRPVEFHCTTPVRTSQIQRILYGPTLAGYLVGEQIGGSLLAKSRMKPKLVITDHNDTLCLSSQIESPVIRLEPTPDLAGIVAPPDASPTVTDERLLQHQLMVGGHCFRLPANCQARRESIAALLEQLAVHVDLAEPFARIHEAIREAHRISNQEPDGDARAA